MKKLVDGKLAPLKRTGRSAKLTAAHVKWLLERLTEQALMYLEEMQALLREKENDPIDVSKSTISRALKNHCRVYTEKVISINSNVVSRWKAVSTRTQRTA